MEIERAEDKGDGEEEINSGNVKEEISIDKTSDLTESKIESLPKNTVELSQNKAGKRKGKAKGKAKEKGMEKIEDDQMKDNQQEVVSENKKDDSMDLVQKKLESGNKSETAQLNKINESNIGSLPKEQEWQEIKRKKNKKGKKQNKKIIFEERIEELIESTKDSDATNYSTSVDDDKMNKIINPEIKKTKSASEDEKKKETIPKLNKNKTKQKSKNKDKQKAKVKDTDLEFLNNEIKQKNKQINIEAEKKKKADKEAKKIKEIELRKKEENEQKLLKEQQRKLKEQNKESENYYETYSEEAQLEEFNSEYFAQQTDKEIFLDYLDMILDEINDFYTEPSLENYVGVDKSIIEFLDNEYKYKYFDGHGEHFKLTLKWRFDKNKFNEIRLPFNSIITEKRAIKLKFDTIFDEFVKEVLVFYKATFKVLIDIVKNNFEKALAIVLNKYHVPEKIISVDEILGLF
uniref:Uncharacterized protein n=1 Tax=Meloidogyne enterolobii TaxID=390850 RepID=A0A6V7Y1C6_MELEN|nr:unnamed protein product [Meloidogyne enterolobii]